VPEKSVAGGVVRAVGNGRALPEGRLLASYFFAKLFQIDELNADPAREGSPNLATKTERATARGSTDGTPDPRQTATEIEARPPPSEQHEESKA
jgi:hypothetical protein